jgi:hypothetical protein
MGLDMKPKNSLRYGQQHYLSPFRAAGEDGGDG